MFEKIEKQASELEAFIVQQNEQSRQMREEMNHLIEYYSVLRKSVEMIFGDKDEEREKKLSFTISNTESVEDLLASSRQDDGRASDASDNSDD